MLLLSLLSNIGTYSGHVYRISSPGINNLMILKHLQEHVHLASATTLRIDKRPKILVLVIMKIWVGFMCYIYVL